MKFYNLMFRLNYLLKTINGEFKSFKTSDEQLAMASDHGGSASSVSLNREVTPIEAF